MFFPLPLSAVFSVEVKACFAFMAHPEHYSPHISKSPPFGFSYLVGLGLRVPGLYYKWSVILSTVQRYASF